MGSPTFQGGVFSDETALGRVGVEIILTPIGLEARTREGDIFSLASQELSLEIGGASGKMIFCRNPERTLTIFSEAPGFLESLTQHANENIRQQATVFGQNLRRKKLLQAAGWGAGLTAVCLVVMFGLSGLRGMARNAVHQIPWEVDEAIGQTMIKQMDLGGPVLDDLVVQDAANRILQRLVPYSSRPDAPFEIHVVESDQVNAFALPGGQMVLFTGLLKRSKRAEEVAGVLAHEIAHVTERHGIDRLVQSVGIMSLVQLAVGDSSGLLGLGAQLMSIAAINSYSREQETAADAVGVKMLHDAGISHEHLSNFFRALEKEGPVHDAASTQSDSSQLPSQVEEVLSWVSTHPATGDRLEAIDAIQSNLPPLKPKALNIDWAAVQKALQERNP